MDRAPGEHGNAGNNRDSRNLQPSWQATEFNGFVIKEGMREAQFVTPEQILRTTPKMCFAERKISLKEELDPSRSKAQVAID